MDSIPSQFNHSQIVKVNTDLRWQVYFRLQELNIPCQCSLYQPLQAKTDHAVEAIQLWSVVRSFTLSSHELVHWLNRCWQINDSQPDNL